VLTVASVLGATGVLQTFLLFVLADTVFGLDRDLIRTLICRSPATSRSS